MTLATDPPVLDKAATIEIIYRAQTDLYLLKEYLACEAYPVLPEMVVAALAGLHCYLANFTPSHSRH